MILRYFPFGALMMNVGECPFYILAEKLAMSYLPVYKWAFVRESVESQYFNSWDEEPSRWHTD